MHPRAPFPRACERILELGRHLAEASLTDRGHARHHDYIADGAGAPDTLLRMRSGAWGCASNPAQTRLVHLGAGRLYPFVQDGERARFAVYLQDICEADVLVWGGRTGFLLPIARSAAVTTSLEADELAVDMITCGVSQNLEFGCLINWGPAVALGRTNREGV